MGRLNGRLARLEDLLHPGPPQLWAAVVWGEICHGRLYSDGTVSYEPVPLAALPQDGGYKAYLADEKNEFFSFVMGTDGLPCVTRAAVVPDVVLGTRQLENAP
jgi:hypothetical protein